VEPEDPDEASVVISGKIVTDAVAWESTTLAGAVTDSPSEGDVACADAAYVVVPTAKVSVIK
jgi:hypothetical protein